MRRIGGWLVLVTILLANSLSLGQDNTQTSPPAPPLGEGTAEAPPSMVKDKRSGEWLQPGVDPENRLVSPFLRHLAGDQKAFWTEPAHLRVKDLKWIVPSAGGLAAFIASDSWWAKQVPGSSVSTSKTVSDYATYSFIGIGGASF